MTVALEVRALDVVFGASAARAMPGVRAGLRDVHLQVRAGECLAVLGVSGSGKSSLLRTLAGLQPTNRGQVLVNGRDVTPLPAEQRGIVYLHQEPVLFPHLSVLDNVAFPLTLRGVAARDAHPRATRWLELLQVADVHGNRPEALSGGQRHRVALARALCAEPDVLLLDEPLSSLDPGVRSDVREALLQTRQASGAAMVLVTHDLDDALAIATHIAAVGRRSLHAAALPAELLRMPPDLETARLLGVYAELPGHVDGSGAAAVFRWCGGSLAAPGAPAGPAIACVRAHEVRVQRAEAGEGETLMVVRRAESAHDVQLELRGSSGELVTVRVGLGVGADVGEVVRLSITHARLFQGA